jgi:hypothetical protein
MGFSNVRHGISHLTTEKNMKKITTLLGMLALGTSLTACADTSYYGQGDINPDKASHGDKAEAMTRYYFYMMDTDHNGYVSRREQESFAAGQFTRADANSDGFLTYHELLDYKRAEWNDFRANKLHGDEYYEGDKYYPYGKTAPTRTPNEPYKANRDKTTKDWKDYQTRGAVDHNSDYIDRDHDGYDDRY